jgi:hypothetical protein
VPAAWASGAATTCRPGGANDDHRPRLALPFCRPSQQRAVQIVAFGEHAVAFAAVQPKWCSSLPAVGSSPTVALVLGHQAAGVEVKADAWTVRQLRCISAACIR